jgi:inner membrane protein
MIWVWIGLVLSSLYLVWTVGVKLYLNPKFEALFQHHQLDIIRYSTRPTAFNSILWTTTAESSDGYYIGFISLLDRKLQGPLYFIRKNHHLNTDFFDYPARKLLFFTDGYYSLEAIQDGINVHDLRFGTFGDPWKVGPQFVFSYKLNHNAPCPTQVTILSRDFKNRKEYLSDLFNRLLGI